MIDENNTVEKITVTYDNGEQLEIEKGVALSFNDDEVTFNMVNIKGGDLIRVVGGVLGLADKLGLFDRLEELNNDGEIDGHMG